MQTLIPTLFPCYAPADRPIAEAVAAYLERGTNLRVFLDEGEIRAGEDLLSKARDARQADLVVVFFSRDSTPSRWARAEWEDALVKEPEAEGVKLAFVRCDDCNPPAVLKPRFELAGVPLKSLRDLKRWVRDPESALIPAAPKPPLEGELEILAIALADRPGVETVPDFSIAADFIEECRRDFDGSFILEQDGRSATALAGDLGVQLGMSLLDDAEINHDRLRQFCSARRFLIVVAGTGPVDPQEFAFGGRCSTLIAMAGSPAETSSDPIRAIQRAFSASPPMVGWQDLCSMARTGRRLTRDQGRIAESYELMERWHALAEEREDRKVLDESAREMVWILEGWGRDHEALALHQRRATEFDDQMHLLF